MRAHYWDEGDFLFDNLQLNTSDSTSDDTTGEEGSDNTTDDEDSSTASGSLFKSQIDSFEEGDYLARWNETKNQSDTTASVTTERSYSGNQSLRIHIGETYSGDYRMESWFDTALPSEGIKIPFAIYPKGEDGKIAITLNGNSTNVRTVFTPFGDVKYGTENENTTEVPDAGANKWYKLTYIVYPDTNEVELRITTDNETVVKETFSSGVEYNRVEVFGGDYSGNVDFYLDDAGYDVPSSAFDVTPDAPATNETVTFNASAYDPPENKAVTGYQWEFGGGSTATGDVVDHTYSSAGSYDVVLTVEFENGTEQVARTVDVAEDNSSG